MKLNCLNCLNCFNCQEFGHGAKFCKNPEICGTCAEIQHDPKPEICNKAFKCKNCGGPHPSWDRKCHIFMREKDIQNIQTINKNSNYQARQRFAVNLSNTPPTQKTSYIDTLTKKIEHKNLSETMNPNTYIYSHRLPELTLAKPTSKQKVTTKKLQKHQSTHSYQLIIQNQQKLL